MQEGPKDGKLFATKIITQPRQREAADDEACEEERAEVAEGVLRRTLKLEQVDPIVQRTVRFFIYSMLWQT